MLRFHLYSYVLCECLPKDLLCRQNHLGTDSNELCYRRRPPRQCRHLVGKRTRQSVPSILGSDESIGKVQARIEERQRQLISWRSRLRICRGCASFDPRWPCLWEHQQGQSLHQLLLSDQIDHRGKLPPQRVCSESQTPDYLQLYLLLKISMVDCYYYRDDLLIHLTGEILQPWAHRSVGREVSKLW